MGKVATPLPLSIDKAAWGDGPWATEHDRVEWRERAFPCLIRRVAFLGHWCGYLAVPPGHPWHGLHFHEVPAVAHGGLNHSSACERDVCHVPEPGEPADVWWVGFDCAHALDLSPGSFRGVPDLVRQLRLVYRTEHYVVDQVRGLAEQAHAAWCHMEPKTPPTGFYAKRPGKRQ